ncbi:TonB-dependent receptor [Nevskia soli]|uniref:TonB-dependent receptor n=1 Tax=Nevskia soli TaxID=418856 RepID=UPI0004A7088C|nr:TonB-dependent receptor [Nevskia soli]
MRGLLAGGALLAAPVALAGGTATQLDQVTVTADRLSDQVDSATVGTVYAGQFENRPLSRPGELLEVVPGLIITQHSGEGKANQYFLRGFNLDHGTDFATWIDDMPVNMPTHAHGQGYSDNNFLVPELVQSIDYRKGPYYPQWGDFSAAGAADIHLRDSFEQNLVQFTGGEYGYGRGLEAGSYQLFGGNVLYGVEGEHYDGAYIKNDNFFNGSVTLRYSKQSDSGSFHLTAMGYSARFDSTDQIPQRAVDEGLVDRLGCFDGGCSDGGKTHRYSFSGGFNRRFGTGELTGSAYALRYKLDLFSDFSYYLLDPVRGDQFEQFDARNVYGGKIAYKQPYALFGFRTLSEAGVQTRYDDIGTVGLYDTEERTRFGTVSQDHVREWSQAVFAETSIELTHWLRATAGLRYDHYDFGVTADDAADSSSGALVNDPANSGHASAGITEPKLTFVAGPFHKTEFFLNLGKGFHSNDGRGTTETEVFDPRYADSHPGATPGDATTHVDKVSALVATRGADLGLRTTIIPHVQFSQSFFILDIDSELTFNGDGGDTSPGDATRRYGTESAVYWKPQEHLVIDADYAYSHSRFRVPQVLDVGSVGFRIPEAATSVFAFGGTYESPLGWFAAARFRYFGPRPLIEDNSVSSHATKVVNLTGGYSFNRQIKIGIQVINALNSKDHDIDYYFASRLTPPGAPNQDPAQGVNSIHFHPIEPTNVRVYVAWYY